MDDAVAMAPYKDGEALIEQFESREYIGKDGEEDVTPIAKFLTEQCLARGIRLVNEKQITDVLQKQFFPVCLFSYHFLPLQSSPLHIKTVENRK